MYLRTALLLAAFALLCACTATYVPDPDQSSFGRISQEVGK